MIFKIRFFVGSLMLLIFLNSCSFLKGGKPRVDQFEGKIIFSYSSKDKTGEMSESRSQETMGDELIFTFKDNKYKQEMGGEWRFTQYYLGKDTVYFKLAVRDTLYFESAGKESGKVIEYAIQNEAETIAGVVCDLLSYKTKEETVKYYFNKKYKIDPKNYVGHKFEYYNFWFEKTNAAPLKIVVENNYHRTILTAKEIKEMKIDNSEFLLPNLPRLKIEEE